MEIVLLNKGMISTEERERERERARHYLANSIYTNVLERLLIHIHTYS